MSITEIIIFITLALLILMHVILMYMLLALKEKFSDILKTEKSMADWIRANNNYVVDNTDTMKKVLKREETMVKLVDATMECYEVFKEQNKTITDAFHTASVNYDEIMRQWKSVEEHYSATYEQYNDIKKRIVEYHLNTSPITITTRPAFEPGPLGYEITCNTKGIEAVNG